MWMLLIKKNTRNIPYWYFEGIFWSAGMIFRIPEYHIPEKSPKYSDISGNIGATIFRTLFVLLFRVYWKWKEVGGGKEAPVPGNWVRC